MNDRFGIICGKAEPVVQRRPSDPLEMRPPTSVPVSFNPVCKSSERMETQKENLSAVMNSATATAVSVKMSSGTFNYDQSSLGSDDSGICCSSLGLGPGEKLHSTQSTENLVEGDAYSVSNFDESKSIESDETNGLSELSSTVGIVEFSKGFSDRLLSK